MTKIFVDTNILYDDPFLQSTNKYLLELTDRKDVELLFSEMVLTETSLILKSRLKEIIHDYKLSRSKLKKLTRVPLSLVALERSKIIEDFDSFYENLKSLKKIIVLSATTEILDLALKDLVVKKAPFFNNKNELKDCIIWYTYAQYALENESENCILLTNNVRDFGDDRGEIHPTLSSSNSFKLIRSIADLKLDLGEVPPITVSQKSTNTSAELKIKDIFQKQVEILIEHLNDIVNDYYRFHAFDNFLQSRRRFIQVSDLELLSIKAQMGNEPDNLQDIFGTATANLNLEVYEISTKSLVNASRINLNELINKPFVFDFEVILDNNDYIQDLEISSFSEIRESLDNEFSPAPF